MDIKHKEELQKLLNQIENLAHNQDGLITTLMKEKNLSFNDALLTILLKRNLLQIIVRNDSNYPNGNHLI